MSDDPIIRPEDREDEQLIDYLFELYGYLILKEAVAPADVAEMNRWQTPISIIMTRPSRSEGTRTAGGSGTSRRTRTAARMV